MNTSDVQDLYRYNEWANRRLLTAAQELPSEALLRDLGGSDRSLRDVLAHIISAEWVWLERWRGMSPTATPDWVAAGGLTVLMEKLTEVETGRANFLRDVSDSALSSEIDFRYLSGCPGNHVLSDLLTHVVNHSTYHRGQVAAMLRQLGATPPSTDFVVFKRELRA
ncbi:MAG: DinB family protein [Acidobacteriota bacterium]